MICIREDNHFPDNSCLFIGDRFGFVAIILFCGSQIMNQYVIDLY